MQSNPAVLRGGWAPVIGVWLWDVTGGVLCLEACGDCRLSALGSIPAPFSKHCCHTEEMLCELTGVVGELGELIGGLEKGGGGETLYKCLSTLNKIRSNITELGVCWKVKMKPWERKSDQNTWFLA